MPLAFLGAIAALPQATPGETALRDVLARYGSLRRAEFSISKSARDRRQDALNPSLSMMVAYDSPTRFRVEQSEYWGGGNVFVSDGKTLKFQSIDSDQTVLRNAGKSLLTSHPMLAPRGGAFAVLFLLLEGPPAYDKLVAPDGTVALNGRRIEFKSKDLGQMTLFLDGKWVSEIQFDNKPNREASFRFVPQFGAMPEDPLEVEAISYRFDARFPKGTFDPSARKGESVRDERKKPPSP